MSKPFAAAFAAMALIIGIVIWYGFSVTKGNHLAPTGSIGKVRIVNAGDDLTYMVIDFHVRNDSDRDMIVRSIEASVETADGMPIEGKGVARSDVENAFRSYPELGDQFNPVLRERDAVPAHQQIDRMVGVRFDAPAERIDKRKHLSLRLLDITGADVVMTK